MFLDAHQLAALTGYRRPHLQAAELRRRGYHFEMNHAGRPVVSRAHVEQRLSGATSASKTGPRLSAVK